MTVPFFSPLYRRIIAFWDPKVPARLRPLWEHPCGPKTVFFWSPLQKWCLVLAGLSDTLTRPAEKMSVSQAGSLACTGYIWARYSLVIIPKNWSLFAVNFFVGLSGTFQLAKVLRYQMSLKEQEQKDSAAVVPA
ncbi:mitochondrial pyruvate carrier 2-like [Amphibalanus amphitrite]|uniref:mitochondrial pyruvate carrier 2-like n=1 Tax=Amphibalanus amphitrite TaxID=1232801 RepID=UPI001C9044BF|nr:mitochondrial pyruvate carrier 2-like [Amphibalanus amphitrite]XP_043236215.1 mitochondrial pyruvate carrier 2-like [Amphibalanus amphitrite]